MTATNAINTQDVGADVVLVVDLDGTLSRTDTLHEMVLRLLASQPQVLFRFPGWLADGKAKFKAKLADQIVVDPADLPLNDAVLDEVRAARATGRRTALVSAADYRQVKAVAEALGLFDEAYGSAEGRNLKGSTKATFLTEQFGQKRFDYIGDARADLPVWSAARKAITVRANANLRRSAEAANREISHIDPPAEQGRAILRALRPHQWSKNLLLFLPILAAHDISKIVPVILGFFAFCLTASGIYIINDLLDLSTDRAHPRKSKRPFAAGDLTAATGAVFAAGLLVVAFVVGSMAGNTQFIGVLGAYLITTFAYSLSLKRKLIVDVLTLAGLYTVRIIAGGAAASVILSPWMLGLSMFLFLALAAVKRQAELTDQLMSGRDSSGRAYQVDDLPVLRGLALTAGHASVLVLALYISSDDVQRLYTRPDLLWMLCPLMLYWVLRMIMKTHRGQMTDDPIVFAATDRVSQILILVSAAIAGAAAV